MTFQFVYLKESFPGLFVIRLLPISTDILQTQGLPDWESAAEHLFQLLLDQLESLVLKNILAGNLTVFVLKMRTESR